MRPIANKNCIGVPWYFLGMNVQVQDLGFGRSETITLVSLYHVLGCTGQQAYWDKQQINVWYKYNKTGGQ